MSTQDFMSRRRDVGYALNETSGYNRGALVRASLEPSNVRARVQCLDLGLDVEPSHARGLAALLVLAASEAEALDVERREELARNPRSLNP